MPNEQSAIQARAWVADFLSIITGVKPKANQKNNLQTFIALLVLRGSLSY